MTNLKIEFPYSIGTYLVNEEQGKITNAQLREYIVGENGIFAILKFKKIVNQSFITRVSMDELLEFWNVDESKTKEESGKVYLKPIIKNEDKKRLFDEAREKYKSLNLKLDK